MIVIVLLLLLDYLLLLLLLLVLVLVLLVSCVLDPVVRRIWGTFRFHLNLNGNGLSQDLFYFQSLSLD